MKLVVIMRHGWHKGFVSLVSISFAHGSLDASFDFGIDGLPFRQVLFEVVQDDEPRIVCFVRRCIEVGLQLESGHLVVALCQIVDGGNAVRGIGVDGLPVDGC